MRMFLSRLKCIQCLAYRFDTLTHNIENSINNRPHKDSAFLMFNSCAGTHPAYANYAFLDLNEVATAALHLTWSSLNLIRHVWPFRAAASKRIQLIEVVNWHAVSLSKRIRAHTSAQTRWIIGEIFHASAVKWILNETLLRPRSESEKAKLPLLTWALEKKRCEVTQNWCSMNILKKKRLES